MLNSLDNVAISAALFILELDRLITDSRVEDDGRIVVRIPVGYVDNDVNSGRYDEDTSARLAKINEPLHELGFRFASAAVEPGAESWTYIALV